METREDSDECQETHCSVRFNHDARIIGRGQHNGHHSLGCDGSIMLFKDACHADKVYCRSRKKLNHDLLPDAIDSLDPDFLQKKFDDAITHEILNRLGEWPESVDYLFVYFFHVFDGFHR